MTDGTADHTPWSVVVTSDNARVLIYSRQGINTRSLADFERQLNGSERYHMHGKLDDIIQKLESSGAAQRPEVRHAPYVHIAMQLDHEKFRGIFAYRD